MRGSPLWDEHARMISDRRRERGGGARPARTRTRARPGVEGLEGRALLSLGVQPDYRVTQDWGSGFQAQVSLANRDSQGVARWTLEFDYASQIGDIWDARVVSHAGSHYVIAGAGWNADLAGGASVS